jgi:hypothetical protein
MARTRVLTIGGVVLAGMAVASYWAFNPASQNSLIFRPLSGTWSYASTYGTAQLSGACGALPPVQRSAAGPASLAAATDGTSFSLDIDGQVLLFHRMGLAPDFESGRSLFPIQTATGPSSGEVWFEAHVDTPSAISGSTRWTSDGCNADYPFTLTLDTAHEPDAVVPQAGRWQVTTTPGSCPTGPGGLSSAFAGPTTLLLNPVASLTLAPPVGPPITVMRTGPLSWSGGGTVSGTVGGVPQVFAGTMHVTFSEPTRAIATFVGAASLCGLSSMLTMTYIGP